MGDPCTPQFVLGWETGNGRACATDPAALHNRDFLAGTAEVPREQLAALATSENDRIELFRPRHDDLSNDSTELVDRPEEHRVVALFIFVPSSAPKRIAARRRDTMHLVRGLKPFGYRLAPIFSSSELAVDIHQSACGIPLSRRRDARAATTGLYPDPHTSSEFDDSSRSLKR
jgi:hypothetical protein